MKEIMKQKTKKQDSTHAIRLCWKRPWMKLACTLWVKTKQAKNHLRFLCFP